MEYVRTRVPSADGGDEREMRLCSFLRAQKREINHALQASEIGIARVREESAAMLGQALPFSLVWIGEEKDIMAQLRRICTQGRECVAIIEPGAEHNSASPLPKGAYITLITNGTDRHCVYAAVPDGGELVYGCLSGEYMDNGWRWSSAGGTYGQ